MKYSNNIIRNTLIIILLVAIGLPNGSAQSDRNNSLTITGKVLAGKKTDITVFQEADNDWNIIRTMKSRKKYTVSLCPRQNYYLVFLSNDGIKKALYVEGGEIGGWVMHLNIDFDQWSVKYATLYQHKIHKNYKLKNTHKNNLEIEIISNNQNTLVNE